MTSDGKHIRFFRIAAIAACIVLAIAALMFRHAIANRIAVPYEPNYRHSADGTMELDFYKSYLSHLTEHDLSSRCQAALPDSMQLLLMPAFAAQIDIQVSGNALDVDHYSPPPAAPSSDSLLGHPVVQRRSRKLSASEKERLWSLVDASFLAMPTIDKDWPMQTDGTTMYLEVCQSGKYAFFYRELLPNTPASGVRIIALVNQLDNLAPPSKP